MKTKNPKKNFKIEKNNQFIKFFFSIFHQLFSIFLQFLRFFPIFLELFSIIFNIFQVNRDISLVKILFVNNNKRLLLKFYLFILKNTRMG